MAASTEKATAAPPGTLTWSVRSSMPARLQAPRQASVTPEPLSPN
jgi:hypothetical protein